MKKKRKQFQRYGIIMAVVIFMIALGVCISSFIYRPNTAADTAKLQNTNALSEQLLEATGLHLDLSVKKHQTFLSRLEESNLSYAQEERHSSSGDPQAETMRYFSAKGEQVTLKGVERISEDGRMKQVLALVYDQKSPKGTYQVIAQCEWLKKPLFLKNETISLTTLDLVWVETLLDPSFITGYYESEKGFFSKNKVETMRYQEEHTLPDQFLNVGENQFFYEFDFPTNCIGKSGFIKRDQYMFQLWITAKVKDYEIDDSMLALLLKYDHSSLFDKQFSNYFMWDYKEDASMH